MTQKRGAMSDGRLVSGKCQPRALDAREGTCTMLLIPRSLMMTLRKLNLRLVVATAAVAAIPALSACRSPTDDGDPARDVAIVRLVAGPASVDITRGGAQGAVLSLAVGEIPLTAVFLRQSGDTLRLNQNDFEIRLQPANAQIVTFARTSAFAGTLTGVAQGNTVVSVSLFHISGNHEDFGPHDLTVVVE